MNANELADELEQGHWEGGTREQAATMLRQQQEKLTKYELRHVVQRDRIAILEMQHKQQQVEIEKLKQTIDANNLSQNIGQFVKAAKTLTDEEILNIAHQIRLIDRQTADDGHLYFARAVIKEVNGKC